MLHLLNGSLNAHGRVGVRVHPFRHPAFEADVEAVIAGGGEKLAFLMIPKPEGIEDLSRAIAFIDDCLKRHAIRKPLPLHTLIETHGALRDVMAIAAHPRIESLSFGLMDFVSAHRGAIPALGAGGRGPVHAPAGATRASWRSPPPRTATARRRRTASSPSSRANARSSPPPSAAREFGYTRMWSIHPNQIQPIIDAFAPSVAEIDEAIDILQAAQAAQWAPIQHRDMLHDRASYRLFWHLLQRAHGTGQSLPTRSSKRGLRRIHRPCDGTNTP